MPTHADAHFGGTEFLRVTDTLGLCSDASIDPRTEMLFAAGLRACSGCPAKADCIAALDSGRMCFRTLSAICPNAMLIIDLFHHRPPRF